MCSQTLEWILQSEGRAKPVLPWVNGIALALSLASKKGKTYLSITKDLQNGISSFYIGLGFLVKYILNIISQNRPINKRDTVNYGPYLSSCCNYYEKSMYVIKTIISHIKYENNNNK